jgi:hypothetical protein
MDIEIRSATSSDSDQLFCLVERVATFFNPERKAFENSLRHLLRDDSVLMNVSVFEKQSVF